MPPPHSARGRGLPIVDGLADAWGVIPSPHGPGKSIWFKIGMPPVTLGYTAASGDPKLLAFAGRASVKVQRSQSPGTAGQGFDARRTRIGTTDRHGRRHPCSPPGCAAGKALISDRQAVARRAAGGRPRRRA
jgi:hypothetical protein